MNGFSDAFKAAGKVGVTPTPLMGEETFCGPYPLDALGENLEKPIRAIMERVKVPAPLAAHSVLSAVSLAVQGHALVRLPTQQVRPPSLFLATVAVSGDRKSTSDDIALEPIKRYEIELNADYQIQRQIHATQHAIWKAQKDGIAKECKGFDASAIEVEVRKLGAPPPEPPRPAFIIPPGSTQGVIDMLDKGFPSVGLFINEGGSWLGSWGMQDEQRTATISAYSELWDGAPVKTLTKGDGFRFMPNRAFSFHVMFQPTYIERLFGDEEMRGQGFLSRILAAQPESLAGTRLVVIGQAEPAWVADALTEYDERLSRIIRAALPIDPEYPQNGLSKRRIVTFSPEASALYWQFYNHVEAQQGKDGQLADVRGFAGKSTEMVGRMAACLHVFNSGLSNLVIDADTVKRAIALMNFYITEALRLAESNEPDPKLVRAQKLSKWLEGWQHDAIAVALIQRLGPLGRSLKADDAKDLCAILARHDHITPIDGGETIDGTRFREAWRIHVGR